MQDWKPIYGEREPDNKAHQEYAASSEKCTFSPIGTCSSMCAKRHFEDMPVSHHS